jgi:predicted unusual protein kinase regulating ubiquinone biosynthesis (AarF/ABC1/UbiB family)
MKHLRAAAPRSSAEEVRRVVEEDLGAPIDRLFARFSDAPIASASIGQVHEALLLDGREVAVKVQHPGIGDAIESDLANAGMLEGFAQLAGGKRFGTKAIFETVRARFREELDYAKEADNVRFFAGVHAGDSRVVVPDLVEDRSSRRVLTTAFVRGKPFDDACAAPEPERRAWAETLWRYVFKGNLLHGRFNADPHPGNYVFQDDGRIAFLDYGCVQDIPDANRKGARAMHEAALRGDEEAFFAGVRRLIESRPGKLEDLSCAYTRTCFEPLFASPYRITRAYAASLVDGMKELARTARTVPEAELFVMPPQMVFINRLQFGFYSVLARLDVEVDFAEVERRFLSPSAT